MTRKNCVASGCFRPKISKMSDEEFIDPVAIPITGELDLHTFRPSDVTRLLDDYFAECIKRGILKVRVVHGKGTGTLRTTVQVHLRRSPHVRTFAQADETTGGWGATWVTLRTGLSK
jgi:DNA-nicking Smr family endonuclease